MHSRSRIMPLARWIGSLLSTVLMILTLVLSPVTVTEAHEAAQQTIVIAVAAQTQAPATCPSYASCTVFVVPSNVSLMTMEALHRLRFLPPQALLLTAFNLVFDPPPPRV